jgi:hypothetical protein
MNDDNLGCKCKGGYTATDYWLFGLVFMTGVAFSLAILKIFL